MLRQLVSFVSPLPFAILAFASSLRLRWGWSRARAWALAIVVQRSTSVRALRLQKFHGELVPSALTGLFMSVDCRLDNTTG